MLIRTATGGKKSLDDFARTCFGGREGDWGEVTYEFEDVAKALNAVYPYDWASFLDQRLRTPGQPAPVEGIERAGYRLVWRDTPNAYDKARMAASTGYDLTPSLGLPLAQDRVAGGPLWTGPAFPADIDRKAGQ